MSMTPSEQRGRLLTELQSLQTLLNKTNIMDKENQDLSGTTEEEIIPILKAVHEAAEDVIPTLTDQAQPLESEQTAESEPQQEEPQTNNDSPYLPKDIIERLASQASAISEQIRKMESEGETQIAESQIIEPQTVAPKSDEEELDTTETDNSEIESVEIQTVEELAPETTQSDEVEITEEFVNEPLVEQSETQEAQTEEPQIDSSHTAEPQTIKADTTELEAQPSTNTEAEPYQPEDEQALEAETNTEQATDTTAVISEEQKQIIINELIEDMLPTLMKQLRARLNSHK